MSLKYKNKYEDTNLLLKTATNKFIHSILFYDKEKIDGT